MNHDALQGGDLDEYFVERFIDKGRHVETQCGRDSHGNFTVYSTRDCSVQRRNQKLVEEAPAPFLPDGVLEQLETYSRRLFDAVDYVGLGTCEFMVTEQSKVYFLEVNPRLQVEHTVSEEVCDNVNAYLAIYCVILVLSFAVISVDGFSIGTNFSAVASCFNNIGPGLGMVDPAGSYAAFSPLAKVVLTLDMLAGRLELFPMLVLFHPVLWKETWEGGKRRRRLKRKKVS